MTFNHGLTLRPNLFTRRQYGRRRGMSLVEVMITGGIVAFAGMGIMATLIYGIELRQITREYNGANRAAGDILERTKRTLFTRLAAQTSTVTIDDRGTPDTADDVTGSASLQYFLADGTEVGTVGSPIPETLPLLNVRVTVSWDPAGRRKSQTRTVVMNSLLAP